MAGLLMGLKGFGENSKLIFIGIAVVLGFIFILQNFEQTSFQFLIWTLFTAPKWIVVSGTFLIGLAFGFLLGKKKA
ncbi:MAG: hypothetical protein ACLQDF_11505 [Desulfomonilia bacterium]